MQNDGYVRLMDRAKDVVVSAGENIATVEVEQAAVSHDAVAEAAVIGVPDEQWGERPKAFAVLAPGQQPSKEEIIDHVRSRIAHYKARDEVVVMDELPKNSAGKVQKFQLREAETAKQARPAEALAG
jgi:fatty-acyl-CoA synthase